MTYNIFDNGNMIVIRVGNGLFLPYIHGDVPAQIKSYLQDNGIEESKIVIPESVVKKYGSQI
jgi:hypothetical protein